MVPAGRLSSQMSHSNSEPKVITSTRPFLPNEIRLGSYITPGKGEFDILPLLHTPCFPKTPTSISEQLFLTCCYNMNLRYMGPQEFACAEITRAPLCYRLYSITKRSKSFLHDRILGMGTYTQKRQRLKDTFHLSSILLQPRFLGHTNPDNTEIIYTIKELWDLYNALQYFRVAVALTSGSMG